MALEPAAPPVNASDPTLTREQREIVRESVSTSQLVLAGAGTGKTFVLVERIEHLLLSNDVAPGRELLVLSFTRAAVREVKRRLAERAGDARLVRPLTFDSFATRLLAGLPAHVVGDDWRDLDYDGRIERATRAIERHEEAQEVLAEFRHVLVDEIQDLAGVRARLVLSILDNVPAFTLFGDPAQAIFDHQIADMPGAMTSVAFRDELRRRHGGLKVRILEENFRARTPQARAVEEVGMILRSSDDRLDEVRDELGEIVRDLDTLGLMDLAFAVGGGTRTTAALCRTNPETMRISEFLFEQGVDHRLQRAAAERVLPGWMTDLFMGETRASWSRKRLCVLVEQRISEDIPMPDAEDVWAVLSNTVGDDERIDVGLLARKLAIGLAPDELTAPAPERLVVSTIHRAKGLEFDDVYVMRPRSDVEDIDDPEELRVLYVALSRAREGVTMFRAPRLGRAFKDESIGDRWVITPWGKDDRWKTKRIEVGSRDVEPMRPFSSDDLDARSVQDYLRDSVSRGDEVELHFDRERTGYEPSPVYTVVHGETPIGETSERFGRQLRRRLAIRGKVYKWPEALTRLQLDGTETVVGLESEGKANGLGTSRLWRRPRVVGMGRLLWYLDGQEESEDD